MQYFFCKSWACVTSNDGNWRWGVTRPDLVKFAFINKEVPGCHDSSDSDMGCVRNERTKKWPLPTQECQPTDLDRIKVTFTDSGKGTPPGGYKAEGGGLCIINMVDILARL
jgi:hypothetical protein